MSSLLSGALTLAAVVAAMPASAFDVEWEAPPECPRAPRLDAFGRARVSIQKRAESTTWKLRIQFEAPVVGERQLEAESCEEAASAATLLLRLAARKTLPALVEVTSPPLVRAEASSLSAPEPFVTSVSAGAVLEWSLFPTVTLRPQVALAIASPAFTLGADVRVAAWVEAEVGKVDAKVKISRPFEVQLFACWLPKLGRVAVGPCAALAVGVWVLRGTLVDAPRASSDFEFAAGPQLRVGLPLMEPIFVSGAAGLRLNLRRPTPFVDGSDVLFTTPLVSGECHAAVGARW